MAKFERNWEKKTEEIDTAHSDCLHKTMNKR